MVARMWRTARTVSGPYLATEHDIPDLNKVFTASFTDRYRRDGLVGTHVPQLSSLVWQFAIDDAADGALYWRGERDEIAAFNMVHRSGVEGWMGPLALEPSYQGHGIGKQMVKTGIDWLKEHGVAVIGLETMPRTIENIGFYSTLGFMPGPLTITLTLDAEYAETRIPQLSRCSNNDKHRYVSACLSLLDEMAPGYDFTREIELTATHALGDTLILPGAKGVDGFAVCHSVSLVEGRAREEVRALKIVARTLDHFNVLLTQLADYTRRAGARRIAVRMQTSYAEAYRLMMTRGAKVRWTDLRMTLEGYAEHPPKFGICLSNWEI